MGTSDQHLIHYDAQRRRLWIGGQRCHHGATGALLTGVAAAGVVAARMHLAGLLVLAATGSVLMAHDWHDRDIWFERGWQNQP
jgi:hypothetical protein